MQFHAIAMPQIGPGKGDGFDGRDDFGRFRETEKDEDMYAFRTLPLHNVALTAPYGHSVGLFGGFWYRFPKIRR